METPEVRQCTDEESHLFGAVAVQAGENRYGVMHPANGGHWATAEQVSTWAVMEHPTAS